MCKTRVLATKGSAVITSCIDCKAFNIWHNNVLLSFSPDEFSFFKALVNELIFDDRAEVFPDNVDRIVIHTPNPNICFTFTEQEWNVFSEAIDEAIYINEIYEMMQN